MRCRRVRIGLLKGGGQYGALRLHADQLASAFTGLGHEATLFDLTTPTGRDAVLTNLAAPPDVYLSLAGMAVDLKTPDGASLYDRLGATFVQIHVDHPAHARDRLTVALKRNYAFFLDRSHVEFVQGWPEAQHLTKAAFLPPGANELPALVDTSASAFAERDIPLLFTGTYRGEPLAPWRSQPAGGFRNLLESIAERMTADATVSLLTAVREALAQIGTELTPALLSKFVPVLGDIQLFTEAYHRDRLLQVLGLAGVDLHVYGRGWEPLVARHRSFTFGGVGSFEETLRLVRRARLVLNTNNGFVEGGHERVFAAMAGGAAVLSDESSYYSEAFRVGEEIATFAWQDIETAPDLITALQSDVGRLAALARAGRARVLADHTWTARAARIIQVLEETP